MVSLTSILPSVEALASGMDWLGIIQAVALLALAIFLIGGVFRLLFGKGSSLNCAVSASLSIMLVYLAAILIYLFLPDLRDSLEPLPFVRIDLQRVFLIDWMQLSEEVFYPSVLKLAILALTVNLLEEFMPEGEKFLSWYLWRTVTVLTSLTAYILICGFVESLVPQLFSDWAKYVIWGFWAVILLTGLLKVLLGLILTVMNPIIGGLYALFFTNTLGRQFSKSILTTVLVMTVFQLMYRGGLMQFAFSQFSLAAYGPSCVIILIVLYLFGKFL